jgi:hypothetical protein
MFFRSLAIEAFHPLSLWQTLALIALRDSIFRMFASYFRCAEFFKDTIGLEEMVVVAGKNSYLSLFQNVLITVECQSLPIDISLSLFYPFGFVYFINFIIKYVYCWDLCIVCVLCFIFSKNGHPTILYQAIAVLVSAILY